MSSHEASMGKAMTKFLVMLEETQESAVAMRFAARRAQHIGAGVIALSVIRADEIAHGMGVADVMRAEARERIEVHFDVYAKWMREKADIAAELVVREGDPASELLKLLNEEPEITIVVLGVGSEIGALTKKLMREVGTLPCALTFVPANLSPDRLEEIGS